MGLRQYTYVQDASRIYGQQAFFCDHAWSSWKLDLGFVVRSPGSELGYEIERRIDRVGELDVVRIRTGVYRLQRKIEAGHEQLRGERVDIRDVVARA
jgi:hypothetical protein